ncbi:N-6 DNA methylase [Streptomyces sp. SID3212]|uniref:N-6 DNA methylase n=1 Tax=Streptomyces sp. SID3212 TaxID=2690259 RepID=UPI00136DD152|nr:N-6 DNA methylase [Streptomyces sp. SID3212]
MEETRSQVDWLTRAVEALPDEMTFDAMQQLILSMVFLRQVSDVPEGEAQGRPTWEELVGQVAGKPDLVHQPVQRALRAWSGSYGKFRIDLDNEAVLGQMRSDSRVVDRALRDLIALLDRAGRAGAKGDLYDQCLARFSEDRVGGDYYTPRDVVRTMVGLMAPAPGDEVYDPACGSAGLLTEAARYVETHGGRPADRTGPVLRLFGQDINARTRSIAAMNLILHGLEDTLPRDIGTDNSLLHGSDAGEKYSVVLANPPFSMRMPLTDAGFVFWRYGPPPKSKADLAWVQHVLGALKADGRAAILLPNGAAFRGGAERRIRAGLLYDDVVAAVIQLPSGLFSHTRVPACLWVFSKSKRAHAATRVLFINAQDTGVQVSRGRRTLTGADAERIASTFNSWSKHDAADVPGWCRTVALEEVEAADFDLQPARYVAPVAAETAPGEDERRVRELTEELYEHFAEASRLEHELRDVLGT